MCLGRYAFGAASLLGFMLLSGGILHGSDW